MRKKYLKLFKEIGDELKNEFKNIYLSKNAKRVVGHGKGGDETTVIDKFAEDLIIKKLGEFHNNGKHNFRLISEELGTRDFGCANSIKNIILVDPLDGSVNAKCGIPFFSVSIALIEGETLGGITVGYVLNLMNGDEFHAVKDCGAFLNNKKIKTKFNKNSLGLIGIEAPIKDSLPYIMKMGKFAERIRIMGSLALDVCYVASGALDAGVFPFRVRPVDFAAGKLILEEAGGVITDFNGGKTDDIMAGVEKKTEIICAGNEKIYDKILEIIRK